MYVLTQAGGAYPTAGVVRDAFNHILTTPDERAEFNRIIDEYYGPSGATR